MGCCLVTCTLQQALNYDTWLVAIGKPVGIFRRRLGIACVVAAVACHTGNELATALDRVLHVRVAFV